MHKLRTTKIIVSLCALVAMPVFGAQDENEVLAVADQALELISAEDFIGLTDLMIDTGMAYGTSFRDGSYSVRARSYAEQRESIVETDFVERGFEPTVFISGTIAMVWYPYDFYSDGEWSHCGVDIFNLVRTNEGWRIAAMLWSSEQPPDCRPHPDGPPASSGQ